jgi:hypothetical protein
MLFARLSSSLSPSPEGIIEDVIGHSVALFDTLGSIEAPELIAVVGIKNVSGFLG